MLKIEKTLELLNKELNEEFEFENIHKTTNNIEIGYFEICDYKIWFKENGEFEIYNGNYNIRWEFNTYKSIKLFIENL